jgi:hypothetical protein
MHMIFDMACQKEMTPKKRAHNGGIYRLPRDPFFFEHIAVVSAPSQYRCLSTDVRPNAFCG